MEKVRRIIWLSTRLLTSEERQLIFSIHGDEVTVAKDSAPLGDDPEALFAYLVRHSNPETMVYTDMPTLEQLLLAVSTGRRFGFFEYTEGRLTRVLHANPEQKRFIRAREIEESQPAA